MKENNIKVNPHSLRTAVSKVEENKIVTRGYNQRDLIEKIRYSDMVFLLLKGRYLTMYWFHSVIMESHHPAPKLHV